MIQHGQHHKGRLLEFHPTGSGVVNTDWTEGTAMSNRDHTAYDIQDTNQSRIGQMLGIASTNQQTEWATKKGQDGYRWSGTAWPDHFVMVPLPGGHQTAIAAAATWFTQGTFASATPSAPPTGSKIWEVRVNTTFIGYLIREGSGSWLRWDILTAQLSGNELPQSVALKFDKVASATFTGSYSEVTENKV